MNNFGKALRELSQYWKTLLLAMLCSVSVAMLWGSNIAALYPIIETTLHGKSVQSWNRGRTTDAEQEIARLEDQVSRLEVSQQSNTVRGELSLLRTRLQAQRAILTSCVRMQPYLDQWLPQDPFRTVVVILSVLVVCTLLKHVFQLSGTMLVNGMAQRMASNMRRRIFDKALSLDRSTFGLHGTSGFTAHLTQTTDMFAVGIASMYNGLISEPLRIIACLTGAWLISWRLTLASLIFAPLAAGLLLLINRRLRGLSRRILDRSIGFHHVLYEVFRALTTVQAFTMEGHERERFRQSTLDMRRAALSAHFLNSLASPLTEVLGILMLCTGLAASAYLVINQQTSIFGIRMTETPLTATSALVFFGMLLGATDPLRKLSGVITGINTGMVAANLLYPLLELQTRVTDPTAAPGISSTLSGIEFRGVSFAYDNGHVVLRNVQLHVPRGERLAIVGPNGGGKSTLVRLLCRFHDPQEGSLLIDGIPVCELPLKDLRNRIAMVTQETELFNESILYNIRYGRWDATEMELMQAARIARVHDFAQSLPDGYNTLVGPNGQRLSGGQRQRVALARALLRDAEILILDEATSQIDAESEGLIHEALASLAQDRTIIMITHRQSTLALATRIIHIENGEVVVATNAARRAA